MPKLANAAKPIQIRLEEDRKQELLDFLTREVRSAVAARGSIVEDGGKLDEWYRMYDAQARNVKDAPFPGAADLSSHIVTEKVDALRSRLVKTLLTEPVWAVEGYGESASKATAVEQIHTWRADIERVGVWLQ